MLKALRKKKTAKKIWIILAVIIVPPFILWGSGSLIRNKDGSGYAGRIFGQKITAAKFRETLDAVRNQLLLQYGDRLPEVEKQLNPEALAWERLLLLYEARKRRISVSDAEVVAWIQKNPLFQRKGVFDNSLYTQLVTYAFRTQPRIFEEQVRQNLLLSKLYDEVSSSVTVSDDEVKNAYRKAHEEVSIYYITAGYEDFAAALAPSEQEIKEYFTKNSLKFKQPLSFNIEYVSLPAEGTSEDAVKDKLIRDMYPRLKKKGADFSAIAAEFGLQVKETGLFAQSDPIPGMGWAPAIIDLLVRAKPGQFLPLIVMDKNYYFLRLKEMKEPYVPEFEAIKDKVKEALVKERSAETAKGKMEECLRKLREDPKTASLEKTAKALGLKYGSTQMFKYGSYIEGLGASDPFWVNAQNLKDEEVSEILRMPSGFYIIKVKEKKPFDDAAFQAEKAEFSRGVLAQKRLEHFNRFVGELQKKAELY